MGFFRNYLMPRGLAVVADEESVAELEKQRAAYEKARQERIKNLEAQAKKLAGLVLEFKEKAEGGKLFGSVSAEDIKEKLAQAGFEVAEVENIHLKELGEYEVSVDFGEDVKGKVKVKIEEEK